MRPFECGRCGQALYFDNHQCGHCGAALGYAPRQRRLVALSTPDEGSSDPLLRVELSPETHATTPWEAHPQARPGLVWRCCANRHTPAACNWLVGLSEPTPQADSPSPWDGATDTSTGDLCMSCRLTTVIPDLSVPGNGERWFLIEQAKRRLVYTLIGMGLAPRPKRDEHDAQGLAFHLLADPQDGPRVLTGHADGVITLNIAEADDATREAVRVAMGEPVRTLLGHLRHEVSHYLQYRWLGDDASAEACRAEFGDERQDYGQALQRYHEGGAPADWAQRFISAYACAHPWEDWAETCAHVLLIVDAVETAARWGLKLQGPAAQAAPPVHALHATAWPDTDELVLDHWLPVARFVNAMNRSLGMPDSYPFLIPDPVLQKMRTVQRLLLAAVAREAGQDHAAAARAPQDLAPTSAEPQATLQPGPQPLPA